MYEVKKGIAIPSPKKGKGCSTSRRSYPFEEMSPGDSFLVPYDGVEASSLRGAITGSFYDWRKRIGINYKHATRREEDGIRFWLIDA